MLKRGSMVGSYRGKWAAVSGYVEEESDKQAYREIWEETSLRGEDVELKSKGEPIAVVDQQMETKWIVHPYLFEVKDPSRIRLNWEHVEARWVKPEEVKGFDTVPLLYETLEKVLKQRL